MFKNIKELKEFIIWCKEHKVLVFQQDGIQFQISEMSFVQGMHDPIPDIADIKEASKFEEEQQTEQDEDLLYYSSNS